MESGGFFKDYKHNREMKAADKLYPKGKITMRKASGIIGFPFWDILNEFGKVSIFMRYGDEELK